MHALIGALAVSLLTSTPPPANDDMSPYFLVKGDAALDQLPLESTSASIEVSGVIAEIKLRQTYTNEGPRPIEAIYVFPMSTKGAVFGMRMTIGERVIHAEIRERKQARADYEKAKEQGQTASLLEAQRPNVLQMNVANVLPGDRIHVEVDYALALYPEDGRYELVLPTVVGPRYTGGSPAPAPGDRSMAPPRTARGIAPTHKLSITAHLQTGVPITELESPSHKVVTVMAPNGVRSHADLLLDEPAGANRDFVLRYRLAGDAVSSGVVLHEGKKESFFLAMLQPPARVEPTAIPPRELVFILDVSGSMGGFPLQTARAFIDAALSGMRPTDRFNLMTFSGGSRVLSNDSLPSTPDNLRLAERFLRSLEGGGGTEIRPALERALAMKRSEDVSTTFVVVTDGYVTVEKEVFGLVRKNLGTANLFSFGIGSSVNRHLIEGLARAGMGEPFVVLNEAEAARAATKLGRLLDAPALTRVKVDFDGFDAYDLVPRAVPDLFVDRPVLVFGKFRGPAKGHIRIEGQSGAGRYSAALDVESARSAPMANRALRYLWARHMIQSAEDEAAYDTSKKSEAHIRSLGLNYGLLTAYTSFVAIDSEARNRGQAIDQIEVPLPMPEGMSSGVLGLMGHGSGGGGKGYGMGVGGLGLRGALASPPKLRTGVTVVRGSMDRAVILRVLKPALQAVRAEYARALAKTPGLSGRVVVKLEIGSDGQVQRASIAESDLNDAALEAKIVAAFAKLAFPKTDGLVVINYPVRLEAQTSQAPSE